MIECEDLIRQLQISAPTDRTSVTSTVQSARKFVDFLDNDQVPWQKEAMDGCLTDSATGIANWKARGFVPLTEDFTGMIIRRSANSYQDQPIRAILEGDTENEKQTADYQKLLSDAGINFVTNDIDELARGLKASLTLVEASEDKTKLLFHNLGRHNAAVKWNPATREIDELLYGTYNCSDTDNNSQRFYLWTKDTIKTFTWDGKDGREESTEDNTYGIIPIAVRYDISPPRNGFWPKPAWEPLIALNEAINMFHTTTGFASTRANNGQFFTNVAIPEGTVFGVDTSIELDDRNSPNGLFAEYKIPPNQVKDFQDWLDKYKADFADQWGVNLKTEGSGSADSGFKLIVEEFPALELRNKRLASAEEYEKRLYSVVKVVADVAGLAKLTGDIDVRFPPPRLPVNDLETWTIWKEKIALGGATWEDYWRHVDPDITDEEIAKRQERLNTAKITAATANAPTFGSIANAE